MFKTQLTEEKIQAKLSGFFAPGSIKYDVDGLYVFNWESDKLLWTKSGYIYEFEIKISKADFKNDFKHKQEKHICLVSGRSQRLVEEYSKSLFEHYRKKRDSNRWTDEQIREWYCDVDRFSQWKKPNYFYYVVPEGMITEDDVPEYAGLVYVAEEAGMRVVKKAQCLHKEKYKDDDFRLAEKFYSNWVTDRIKFKNIKREKEEYKTMLNEELQSKNQEKSYHQIEKELADAREEWKHYRELYLTVCDDRDYLSTKCRMLQRELLKFNPDFNINKIEEKVDDYLKLTRKR